MVPEQQSSGVWCFSLIWPAVPSVVSAVGFVLQVTIGTQLCFARPAYSKTYTVGQKKAYSTVLISMADEWQLRFLSFCYYLWFFTQTHTHSLVVWSAWISVWNSWRKAITAVVGSNLWWQLLALFTQDCIIFLDFVSCCCLKQPHHHSVWNDTFLPHSIFVLLFLIE